MGWILTSYFMMGGESTLFGWLIFRSRTSQAIKLTCLSKRENQPNVWRFHFLRSRNQLKTLREILLAIMSTMMIKDPKWLKNIRLWERKKQGFNSFTAWERGREEGREGGEGERANLGRQEGREEESEGSREGGRVIFVLNHFEGLQNNPQFESRGINFAWNITVFEIA